MKIEEVSTWRRRQGWEFPEQREQNVRSCAGVKGRGQYGEPCDGQWGWGSGDTEDDEGGLGGWAMEFDGSSSKPSVTAL